MGKETEYHGKASAIFNGQDLLEITIYKGNKNNGANSFWVTIKSLGDKMLIWMMIDVDVRFGC